MKKPNLLFIYTDEQAFDTMAAYGNTQIEMPNLNKLANDSTVFEHAYVTQPVCTPSRSTLLTGLYPHENGCTMNNIPLPRETKCFPELLADSDYRTGHFGKWHLGDEIFKQHGFDEWVSIEDAYKGYYSEGRDKNKKSDYHSFLKENGFRPADGERFGRGQTACFPEKYSKPAFLAEKSKCFIEENKDRPFALFVNFLEPHMPFYGPRDEQYDPEDIPLPLNFNHQLNELNPLKTRLCAHRYQHGMFDMHDLSTPEGCKKLRACYWGLCSLVDTYVGEIIKKLKECDLYDDTIIVFTSDHGDMMGSHGLLAKCVMFEEAVRVPFLVKLDGQNEMRRVKGPVSQIDIVPTILELMDKDIPENLNGKSLKSLTENGGIVSRDNNVFIEWLGPNGLSSNFEIPMNFKDKVSNADDLDKYLSAQVCTIITPDGWKYNWSPLGEDELYNLNEDRNEMNNLAFNDSQKEKIADLRGKIQVWKDETKYPAQ